MDARLMFRITGAALGIQLALGGLVTFNFIDASPHIVWGIVFLVLAIVTLVFVNRMPGKPKPLMNLSVGIVADTIVQGLLGFAALGTSSNANLSNGVAWVHLLNAFAIFAMILTATGMLMGMARMSQGHPMPSAPPAPSAPS